MTVQRVLSEEGLCFRKPISLPGVCLFADLAGFTPLSESLAKMGREGAEVLTRILNQLYTPLVQGIEEGGGDVMRFAGDAVTVYFPSSVPLEAVKKTARRMLEILKSFQRVSTPVGTFSLSMKLGLARGEATLFFVGEEKGWDYVFAGPPVDQAAEAEHQAKAGEMVFHPSWENPVPPTPVWKGEPQAIPDSFLQGYLPPKLWEGLEKGKLQFLNEHRQVTVIFLEYREKIDFSNSQDLETFNDFYGLCRKTVEPLGGYINKVDCGDKGNKLLMLFGAPIKHEDDPERALKTLEVLRKENPLRAGINHATAFCGLVGSEKRWEYTVMGDGVNVSARLMQASKEVLASPYVVNQSKTFRFTPLPPIKLKGKKEPLKVYALEGPRGAPKPLPTLIGRKEALQKLRTYLQELPPARIKCVVITGRAGVGKSALAHHFFSTSFPDASFHYSRLYDYTRVPYYPFKKCLLEVLEGLTLSGCYHPKDKLLSILQMKDPDLLPYAPLLLNLLGLPHDDSVPSLDAETQKGILGKMMGYLLEVSSKDSLHIWHMENGEHVDPESLELFNHLLLTEEKARWLFCFTSRTPLSIPSSLQPLTMELQPFNKEEVTLLLKGALSCAHVPEKLVEEVYQRSEGVPLHALEILDVYLDQGLIFRDEALPDTLIFDPSPVENLPQSLSDITMTKLDRLPLRDQERIKKLCVVGANIPLSLAQALNLSPKELLALPEVTDLLNYNPESQHLYFPKEMERQAIYESLDFALRRKLHDQVARAYEKTLPLRHAQRLHLLAYHYGKAEAKEGIPYLQEAYKKAKAQFALQSALDFGETLWKLYQTFSLPWKEHFLDLLDIYLLLGKPEKVIESLKGRMGNFPKSLKSKAYRLLGEAYRKEGRFQEAKKAFERAIHHAQKEEDQFLSLIAQGKLFGQMEKLTEAKKLFQGILKKYKAFSETKDYRMVKMHLAFLQLQLGEEQKALAIFRNVMEESEEKGDIHGIYISANNLGHIYFNFLRKNKVSLKYFSKSFDIIKKYGILEKETMLMIFLNMGLCYLVLANIEEAENYFNQAYLWAKKMDSPLIYKGAYLLGALHYFQGHYALALEYYLQALKNCEENHIPKHEVLEWLLDFYFEIHHLPKFQEILDTYLQEIETYHLEYLKLLRKIYQAWGKYLEGKAMENELENLWKTALNLNLYEEAFYAGKALFFMTLNPKYVQSMIALAKKMGNANYKLEASIYDYLVDPNQTKKQTLLRMARKFAQHHLLYKLYLALYIHTGKKNYFKKAEEKRESLMKGLPWELKEAFIQKGGLTFFTRSHQ